MDYPSNLWDLSVPGLPQQLAPIDDSDFLSILSKQLNPAPLSLPPSAPAQDLSPPFSDDSSPSPPAAANRGLDKASAAKRDDMRKRTIQQAQSDDEDDDIEGQPQSKSQKEQPGKKGTKRKSTGDESRAAKRKEQNRAAQRAFRERKEKHVKDLEDQVAELEAKGATQATENENLRELLGRLQNENLMLKQSAFTFNLSSNGTPRSSNITSRPTPSVSSPTSSIPKSGSTPASALAPTPADSPEVNHQLGLTTGPGYTPLLSFNNPSSNSLTTLTSPTQDESNNFMSMMSTDNTPPLTFLTPPESGPSPYTTIASNPMYTSYTDFSAWDQFFADSAMDQTLAGVNADPSPPLQDVSSGGMEDLFQTTGNYSNLIPFSGFSPSNSPFDNNNGMTGIVPASTAASSPIEHRTSSAHQDTGAFTLASRETTSERPSLLKPRSSSPCGGADPDEAPLPGSERHNPNHLTLSGAGLMNGPPQPQADEGNCGGGSQNCPNSAAEVAAIIEKQPIATLGTVPGMKSALDVADAKKVRLNEVWATLKAHPRFDEVDMDELCRELSAKVRCDGTMPGIDSSETPCQELHKIVDGIKSKKAEAKRADSAASTASVPTRLSPEAQQQQEKLYNGGSSSAAVVSSPRSTQDLSHMFNPYDSFLSFGGPPQLQQDQQQQQRPSLSTSVDSSSSSELISPALQTPASATMPVNTTPSIFDTSSFGVGTGMEPWMTDLMGMASPGSQFMAYLNGGTSGGSGFSPNTYLNLGDKE